MMKHNNELKARDYRSADPETCVLKQVAGLTLLTGRKGAADEITTKNNICVMCGERPGLARCRGNGPLTIKRNEEGVETMATGASVTFKGKITGIWLSELQPDVVQVEGHDEEKHYTVTISGKGGGRQFLDKFGVDNKEIVITFGGGELL